MLAKAKDFPAGSRITVFESTPLGFVHNQNEIRFCAKYLCDLLGPMDTDIDAEIIHHGTRVLSCCSADERIEARRFCVMTTCAKERFAHGTAADVAFTYDENLPDHFVTTAAATPALMAGSSKFRTRLKRTRLLPST